MVISQDVCSESLVKHVGRGSNASTSRVQSSSKRGGNVGVVIKGSGAVIYGLHV